MKIATESFESTVSSAMRRIEYLFAKHAHKYLSEDPIEGYRVGRPSSYRPADERDAIMDAFTKGMSRAQAVERFGLSKDSARYYAKKCRLANA